MFLVALWRRVSAFAAAIRAARRFSMAWRHRRVLEPCRHVFARLQDTGEWRYTWCWQWDDKCLVETIEGLMGWGFFGQPPFAPKYDAFHVEDDLLSFDGYECLGRGDRTMVSLRDARISEVIRRLTALDAAARKR